MGIIFSIPCFCWPSNSDIHHHRSPSIPDQLDEHTPLISDPPPRTLPLQPQIDLVQQSADEAAANVVVDRISRFLADVESEAPFSHLRVASSIKEPVHTPDGSASTWRAYDPPLCSTIPTEVSRLRLGFDQPCRLNHHQSHQPNLSNQKSFHSLKTIINHSKHSTQSPPANSSSNSNTYLSVNPHGTSTDNGIVDLHSRDSSCAPSTQFDTIRSYRTAVDDTDTNASLEALNTQLDPSNDTTEFVGQLCLASPQEQDPDNKNLNVGVNDHEDDDNEDDEPNCLTDDPQKLKILIASGFKLQATGPILVEL